MARIHGLLSAYWGKITRARLVLSEKRPKKVASVQDPDKNTKIARQFFDAIPYCRTLNMRLDEIGAGQAEMSMPYDERLIGDPATGVISGGVVSALMDSCGGAAVISHPDNTSATATIDLRIDYMRSATPGQRIRAKASCFHVTRSVAFVRAQAFDDDETIPVATAAGAFTFVK
ncbi:MAG: PaaI family thioesterase [Paracoccaceae bacterium]|nr:PaaI family thioesterase [Paracoccaceae bacterium]